MMPEDTNHPSIDHAILECRKLVSAIIDKSLWSLSLWSSSVRSLDVKKLSVKSLCVKQLSVKAFYRKQTSVYSYIWTYIAAVTPGP